MSIAAVSEKVAERIQCGCPLGEAIFVQKPPDSDKISHSPRRNGYQTTRRKVSSDRHGLHFRVLPAFNTPSQRVLYANS